MKDLKDLKSIINELSKQGSWDSEIDRYRVISEWPKIVGDIIAKQAIPVKIIDKKLLLRVENPIWKTEILYMRHEIREKIKQASNQKIIDIIIV